MMRSHTPDHRARRIRPSRRRRTTPALSVETLEGRTLLSLSTVKDISTVSAFPAAITNVNGKMFYLTRATDGGTNLVVSSGTKVTILKDFNTASSYASGQAVGQLTAVGSKLFLVANGGSGQELWVSDGTIGGTTQVKDLNPGPNGSNPKNLTAVGSKLFFTASNVPGVVPNGGLWLYETDGTAGGTTLVPNLAGQTGILGASSLASFQGKLYFSSGNHIDVANGLAGGTSVLAGFTLSGGDATTPPTQLTVAGSSLYFVAQDPTGNPALWVTNGTTIGTTLLQSFVPPVSFNPLAYQPVISSMKAVGSKLFFAVDDAAHGPSLWVSNGTSGGTSFVKTLPFSAKNYFSINSSPIGNATAAGSKLFFTTADGEGSTGIELWVSDGTGGGTTKVTDINPAVQDYSPTIIPGQFAALNGNLFFSNYDSVHGMELWRSNGTPAGTIYLRNLNPGAASSFPGHMAVINNSLYFSATDGAGGDELWQSNGTAAGTVKVRSLAVQATDSALTNGFNGGPRFGVLGNLMLFSAEDNIHGNELWRTDGSTGGTVMLRDLDPGPLSSTPSNFMSLGNKIFFTTQEPNGGMLWVSDGTSPGTVPLMILSGTVMSVAAFPAKGELIFSETVTNNGSSNSQVWVSDGTVGGTAMLKSFAVPSPFSYGAGEFTAYNGKLYFSAPGASNTRSMWVSDGTAGGTAPFDPTATFTNAGDFKVYKGKLAFVAKDGAAGAALFLTDGTPAGTQVLAHMGQNAVLPTTLVVAGPNLYFFIPTPGNIGATSALWKSNGTAPGTGQVTVLTNAYIPDPEPVGLANGNVVFEAGTKSGASNTIFFHPWVSDGTVGGTKQLKDIQADLIYAPKRVINGLLYFSGADDARGEELWQTDGTTAGTTLVQNVAPGAFPSFPSPLASLNGNLIIVAQDGVHGFELLTSGNPTAPQPPTILPIADRTGTVGVTLTIPVKAIDSNPTKALTYSLAPGAPPAASINASTGLITWKPGKPQIAKITVKVTDNSNPALSAFWMFTVTVS